MPEIENEIAHEFTAAEIDHLLPSGSCTAKHLSQRIILIDGYNLADLTIEHDIGVRVSRSSQFNRIDEEFFSEED